MGRLHCLVISPGEKIGPLELGMTPKQIWNALSCLCAEWGFSISDTHIDETWEKGTGKLCCRYLNQKFFFIVWYRQSRAIEIAVDLLLREQLPLLLYGMDIFQTEAEKVLAALKQVGPCLCDAGDEQLGTNYEFSSLGLRLWRERAFHRKLLLDKAYREEMALELEEEYQYLYFQIVAVIEKA